MAIQTTHNGAQRIAGSTDYNDHLFSLDSNGDPYGYQISNAIVHIDDTTVDGNGSEIGYNLYLDAQTMITDGSLVVGTIASKELYFATDGSIHAKFTTDGYFDLLSSKLKLNGNTGAANQVMKSDGYGNLSWTNLPTQQQAFGNITVSGQSTIQADQTGDTLDFVAGSGISLTTDASNDRITISASGGGASNAFKTIVAGGNNIVADSSTDTVTLVAGSNVTISSNSTTDTITIAASTSGDANQNAFTNIASTNQNTIQADASTDTLTIDSDKNSSMDSRYKEDRDQVDIITDSSAKSVKVNSKVPKTLSMVGKTPVLTKLGVNSGVPLRNKFFNVATSDAVSGGGGYVGVSTRSIPLLNTSGSTQDILMPAKTDNSTLQLSFLDSSGSSEIIDMEVAE
jgi:hypothetical protein